VPAAALPDAVVALTLLATALPAGRVATALLAAAVATGAVVAVGAGVLTTALAATEPAGRVAAAALAAADVGAAVVGAAVVAAGFGVSVALLPPHAARIALPAVAPAMMRNRRRPSRAPTTSSVPFKTSSFDLS